jgi:hypothetical protein
MYHVTSRSARIAPQRAIASQRRATNRVLGRCRHSTHTALCNIPLCAPYPKLSELSLYVYVIPILTLHRKHWRQLDDFHSLTDLKIHVSAHKEPQITAGLRSVCWKVPFTAPFLSLQRSWQD